MADLNDLQAAQSVKVVGASTSGIESTPVKASLNGDLGVADILDNGGVQGNISVGTTAVACRVGGSNLANRKNLTVYNNGTQTLFWGYTNAVTTANGTHLMRNQQLNAAVGPNTTIWIIASSGSHNVRITEGA